MVDISLEEQDKMVKSYFRSIIAGYLVHYLQTLLEPHLDEKDPGGCSAPLAMAVFSTMNQLGYLTSRKNTKEICKEARTEDCIKEFCNDWMAKVDQDYKKSTIQEIMVNFFRHGLAHQFISIASSAITRDPKQAVLIQIVENEKSEKGVIMQVKILAQNLLKAIDLIQNKIELAKENDPDFITQFFKRLDSQAQKHIDNSADLYKKAEKNLEINSIQGEIYYTTASGTKTITENSMTTITV